MPFKSEAQREHFQKRVARGKMSQAAFDEFEVGTPAKLSRRLHAKKRAEPKHPIIRR